MATRSLGLTSKSLFCLKVMNLTRDDGGEDPCVYGRQNVRLHARAAYILVVAHPRTGGYRS